MLNGESACLRKRLSAILLLRKIHSSQELLETTGGAQQIGLGSNFGPDQRGRHAARTPFSAMRMPHPYLPMPRRASTYHPAKHIARLMPDATANAECLIRVSQPSMRLSYRSDV